MKFHLKHFQEVYDLISIATLSQYHIIICFAFRGPCFQPCLFWVLLFYSESAPGKLNELLKSQPVPKSPVKIQSALLPDNAVSSLRICARYSHLGSQCCLPWPTQPGKFTSLRVEKRILISASCSPQLLLPSFIPCSPSEIPGA